MKAFRVLAGSHAGVQVPISSGTYRISAAENADICISDWAVDEVMLAIGDDGVARLLSGNGDEVLVADFVAVPFGDVVLCVGPEDAAWPRDLDLLAGLLNTTEPPVKDGAGPDNANTATEPERAPRRFTRRTAAVALMCTSAIGGLTAAGVMLASTQSSEAANVKFAPNALATQIDDALHRAGSTDLHAVARKNSVAVEGIVPTADDDSRVQRIVDGLAPGKVHLEYDVAQEDVANIQQSLAGTGARVTYEGHGVFRVSGNVKSMSTFETLIADVRADLNSNARRIEINVKEAKIPVPADIEYTEVVATGRLRYIETPDGTKHLFPSIKDEADN
ncbi:HrpD5 family protein [Paraburkholderia sp. SARCC-3016]|uniref:HrpD5 family protein n=1 Tax=Paraburkholderia sp. SARCC-3016 TaxID=3058611 RepID=UPI0028091789|nr:HrpD5 family protein [Paraburkholderia sp. SARCC-3016]MDQ7980273.1 HrpD5 family protein [Paraburkholderia sp. SARCC-3016]